jgi:hypothetical protein
MLAHLAAATLGSLIGFGIVGLILWAVIAVSNRNRRRN